MITLLLIEPHEDASRVLSYLLRKRGFEVIETCYESALEIGSSTAFDVLLCDVSFYDQTCVGILKTLRAQRSFPAIAMAPNCNCKEAEQFREEGFTDCITLPFDIELLEAAIARLLAEE